MWQKIGLAGRPGAILGGANIFLLLLLWVFSWWRWRLSPDFIPLHYTVYFGFDRFGPRSDIFLFAALGSVLLAINWLVTAVVFKDHRPWQTGLLLFNLALEAVLLAALFLAVLKRLS